jgi:hypothetical protein
VAIAPLNRSIPGLGQLKCEVFQGAELRKDEFLACLSTIRLSGAGRTDAAGRRADSGHVGLLRRGGRA